MLKSLNVENFVCYFDTSTTPLVLRVMDGYPGEDQTCACVFGCRGQSQSRTAQTPCSTPFPESDLLLSLRFLVTWLLLLAPCQWCLSLSQSPGPCLSPLTSIPQWTLSEGREHSTGRTGPWDPAPASAAISQQHPPIQLLTNFCPCHLRQASKRFPPLSFYLPYFEPKCRWNALS